MPGFLKEKQRILLKFYTEFIIHSWNESGYYFFEFDAELNAL
jgi:hypothetical protein